MRINLSKLKHTPEATHTFRFQKHYPSFSMGADLLTLEDVLDVDLTVIRVGESFMVSGSVQTRIRVVCARCLEEFTFPLTATFEDEWMLKEDFISDNEIFRHRQDDLFCFTEEEMDVTERIVEHLIINLPMRFICSNECRGLCPQCGHNMNTDPCTCQEQAVDSRLESLAQWNLKNNHKGV